MPPRANLLVNSGSSLIFVHKQIPEMRYIACDQRCRLILDGPSFTIEEWSGMGFVRLKAPDG